MCYEKNADYEAIDVDFGETETGVEAVKTIEIVNKSDVRQTYEAHRDAATNPLDHVFELCSYSWTLSSGQVHKCKIYYRPFVPFSINVDYFTIVDSAGERAEIRVRGMCIGPVIFSSTTRLVMTCTLSENCANKRIKLINESNTRTVFQFDIDPVQNSFKVNPSSGHIGPRSRKNVTITFAPREEGIHALHLPCLILNHLRVFSLINDEIFKWVPFCIQNLQKPIIVELYGYCAIFAMLYKDIRFNYPTRSKNGFEGYTSDTVVTMQDLPVVSLSKNYIDFGRANVQTEHAAQNIPQTFCLTNHSQSDVLIKWCQDVEETFNVTPATARIPANQTALFEVVFNPDSENKLFARELIGYVFTEQQQNYTYEEVLAFPTIISVRLIGHSFPVAATDLKYQILMLSLPLVVRMPPCVPSFLTYTTFLIRKYNPLPLMFSFVPPPCSRFVVKPMMGIINQDYQIIVVGMIPGVNEHIHEEYWTIMQFNGDAAVECSIYFRGFTECANIDFDDQKNIINLTPTFPGCQQTQFVRMRNVTRHLIRYKFINVPCVLRIQNISGEICSNDIMTHEWEFCPLKVENYELELYCVLIVLKDGIPIGTSVCVTLHAIGKCELGFLTATPDKLDFGVLAYKATNELSFRLCNSSPVNIHYKLRYRWLIENIENDVKIEPIADTVPAGKDKTITVSVTFFAPKYYKFVIEYFVRINSYTDALVEHEMPRSICKLHCLCVLPSLKIVNLQCSGPCPEMSKAFLWKLLKINTLNTLFRELQPETSETLYIDFPMMTLCKRSLVIKLLVTSATAVIASWNIKRVQLCSCRPVVKTEGLSFPRTTYEDCLHRKICSVEPRTGNLKSGEDDWITVELHYTLLGKTELKWDLNLGDNRHIFFIMAIETLSESDNKLCLLTGLTHFRFQDVYFGDNNAIYQVVCWVHNGTNNNIPFSVNPRTMREINQEYCYEVFSCATTHTVMNPLSSVPILLKFQPRHFGIFKGTLHLILGDEEKELTLEGESLLSYEPMVIGEYVPSDFDSWNNNISLYFNTDCIDISCIAMHSRAVNMIIIYNKSQNAFEYEWKRFKIPGVIRIDIHPRKGLIKSMSMKSFHITIYTEQYPCIIDVNVPCKFINTCERRLYQRSIYEHEELCRELEGQFTITEKGVSIPQPWTKILNKPQPFYKTITIRCSIYSVEDKFLKVSLNEELINAPPNQICIEENGKCTMTFKRKDIDRCSFIIEGLLWEIINSRLFKSLMQDISQSKPNLFYSQFTMNLYERKRLIRRSYISPPRALINCILEKMLFIIMHEEYGLKTEHLIERDDIRHKNY